MADLLTDLYEIVEKRRAEREEGSYTVYLFDAGLDKILKKIGEETSETIIAAKNLKASTANNDTGSGDRPLCSEKAETNREDLVGEVGDLLYHLIVMLNDLGVNPSEVEDLLRARMQKTGNLKPPRKK